MCQSPLVQDRDNRNRELEVLKTLIEYISKRNDENDPGMEFRKQNDYGFLSDVIVLLCPLHPLIVRFLPEDYQLKDCLSQYLRENCDLQFGDLTNYSNEQCLANLGDFLQEKEAQLKAMHE